jgi:hypothetical protein
MQSAGLATPGATPDAIENLQKGLADLQSSVDELSKQLQALTAQVLAKLTQTQYNQIVVPAVALSAQINGVESNLAFYAQGCPPLPENSVASTDPDFSDFCRDQKVTIVSQLNDVQINHSFETLSAFVLDNPVVGFKGLPHLFSQALGETVRFFRPTDSTRIQNMFDYWDAVQIQGANLKVELLHLNGAQNNPGGIAQLKSFLGDEDADPPKKGTLQNTRDLELKLLFPPVPGGTVINAKDRMMWAITYPDPKNPGPCGGPPPVPPRSSATNFPVAPPYANAISWNGISGWRSPSFSEVQALLEGRTGASPIAWLIDQTKAVAPDFPVSPGFPDVNTNPNNCPHFNGPWGWTGTAAGKDWVWIDWRSGRKYVGPIYYAFRLDTGEFSDAVDRSWAQRPLNDFALTWVYLDRPLPANEQYYWYP